MSDTQGDDQEAAALWASDEALNIHARDNADKIAAWIDALPSFRGKGVGTKVRTGGFATAIGLRSLDIEELGDMGVQRGTAKQL